LFAGSFIGFTEVSWAAACLSALDNIGFRFELFCRAQPSLAYDRIAGALGEVAIPGSELAQL
jgi:hypothetical protein